MYQNASTYGSHSTREHLRVRGLRPSTESWSGPLTPAGRDFHLRARWSALTCTQFFAPPLFKILVPPLYALLFCMTDGQNCYTPIPFHHPWRVSCLSLVLCFFSRCAMVSVVAVTERWSYRLLDQAVRLRVDRRCSLVQEQDLKEKKIMRIKTSSSFTLYGKKGIYS